MSDISQQQLDNEVTKIYEKCLQRVDDIQLTLGEMENLIESQQTDRGNKNPSEVRGTYLDKENRTCPFNMCGGKRAVRVGPKTSTQCPCVKPGKLREYKNKKPQTVDMSEQGKDDIPF